jgi:Tol biopolymer transport system component
MAPDGKSLVTAVGSEDDTVWVHDDNGDHQLSTEGSSSHPSYSADGASLYFLTVNGQTHKNELWRRDMISGQQEKVLPGYSMRSYAISSDEKKVAFVSNDQGDRSSLWVAATDRSSSAVNLSSGTNDDSPFFLPNNDIVFRSVENGRNIVTRMKPDGSGRSVVFEHGIDDLVAVSPDGRWAIAVSAPAEAKEAFGTIAIPINGGAPVPLCRGYCDIVWDLSGKNLFAVLDSVGGTFVVPVLRDTGLPKLPDAGFAGNEDFRKAKPVSLVPWRVTSALNAGTYAYVRRNTRRNLYRIPLQ